jgi:hypothetical protein
MLEIGVLRKIFGAETEQTRRGWRRLRDKELNIYYQSQNIIRVMRSGRMKWAEYLERMEDETKSQRSLFETAVLKGTLVKRSSREEYNIKRISKRCI